VGNKRGRKFLAKKAEGIKALHDRTAAILNKYQNVPLADSQATRELNAPKTLASGILISQECVLVNTFQQGSILIEVAADQLIALSRSLSEDVLTFAPWTCLRALMEASALSCWLLDLTTSPEKRIARGFACRYEDLSQQKLIAHWRGDTAGEAKVDAHITKIEREAGALGYQPVKKGIGLQWPGPTNRLC
jgi:hypothetical protein